MRPPRSALIPLFLLLVLATPASAQDDARARAVPLASPAGFDQIVYKGLVGNVLDAVPMDASDRLDLQRANAVVGNTLLGRSLAILAGLSNPVLLLGGFVWGMWAAANIAPVEAAMKRAVGPGQSGGGVAAQAHAVALLNLSSAATDTPANAAPGPVLLSSNSAGDSGFAAPSRPRVIKIWLPQRSPAPLR
jgi:hypothetical protein